jgi:hypothetical protein
MGYAHIENLYKIQTILLFKECFAMEKIHGTSAHVHWNSTNGSPLSYSPGGESPVRFAKALCGDEGHARLSEAFKALGHEMVTVYGEAYGGSCQGMKATYGPDLRFVAFEVQIGDVWLNVENACDVALKLGLEFVHFKRIPATVEAIDAERDAWSVQAQRNGMGAALREGIVLRPIDEFVDSRGERVICKHKRDEFKETATPRPVVDPAQLEVLSKASAVALEWVTDMRMQHVLQAFPEPRGLEVTGRVIKAMTEDVMREGSLEIADTREVRKAIGERASKMYRALVTKAKE